MRTIWIVMVLLLGSTRAQAPAIQWDRSYGGIKDDQFQCIAKTDDGGCIIGGVSESDIVGGDKSQPGLGHNDIWVVKLDVNGNKEWDKTYGGDNGEYISAIRQTSDGGYILCATTGSILSGDISEELPPGANFWILKIDQDGNKLWDKGIGGGSEDWVKDVRQTGDGGYILGGWSNSDLSFDKTQESKGSNDYWIVKLNASGSLEWERTFGGPDLDILTCIIQTNDGGYILGGDSRSGIGGDKTQNNLGYNDIWLIKVDENGNKIWDKTLGGDLHDNLSSILITDDNNLILGATSNSGVNGDKSHVAGGEDDYWILKLDVNGNKIWDKSFGGVSAELLTSLQLTNDNGFVLAGTSNSYRSGNKLISEDGIWIVKLADNGDKVWEKAIKANGSESYVAINLSSDNGFLIGCATYSGAEGDKSENSRGLMDYWIVKLSPESSSSHLQGTLTTSSTCTPGVVAPPSMQLRSTDGKYRTWSSYDGNYNLYVYDTLQHSYNVLPPRYFSTACADFTHKFTTYGDTVDHDFTIKQDTACLLLKVDMATARHRRCFDNNIYYIDYRNAGTEAAQNAYIHVRLDSLLQPISSTLPWRLPQSGNDLYFDLGTLTPGQVGQIKLTYKVSCDALLNQTLCSRAHIYPDSSCWKINPDGTPAEPGAPNNNTWDKSSVKVTGRCSNDSALFTITNTGEPGNGDMDGNSQYRVYVNDGLAITQNFRLTGGQSLTLRYYAPGYSIRLEADQRPGHPGFSKPRETLACGEMTAKTTFLPPVGSPPQDDEDVFVEEDCQRVIGAYDPNDKAVYPSGISEKQYVKENTLMEYKVRFQNTGTDTAFNIVVRDTLDNNLDLSTVEPGVASHPYTFATNGRVLIWYFDNIQLPDSFVNEPKSHGFFKFKVRQNANLPRGTVVTNRVGIYFDYNDPVITNEAWFTVGDTTFASPISVSQLTARTTVQDAQLQLYPNPTASNLTVVSPQPGTYVLQNLLGQPVLQGALPVGRTTLLLEALPAGTYLLRATIGTTTEVHKVVKR